ncbi:MAG: hypothetical protein AMS15_09425 [Planctomycetes bacterium DG_23]|nr:MAG: hypothetical protein AMS15_09425 [Planctomycetes bacterium DG_23]
MGFRVSEPNLQGDTNSQAIRAMFGRIAPKYDLINRVLSLGLNKWVRRKTAALAIALVKNRRSGSSLTPSRDGRLAQGRASLRHLHRNLASAIPNELILDLSTGTGAMALALARRDTRVIGLDFSQEMLSIAKKKCAHTNIKLIAADAFNLPFKSGLFNLVIVAFALRSMANVKESLESIKGALRPGGKVLILEFGMPRKPLVRFFYRIYVRFLVPLIGGTISGDKGAYKFLSRSIPDFSQNNDLKEALQQSGFQEIRYSPIAFGIYEVYVARLAK